MLCQPIEDLVHTLSKVPPVRLFVIFRHVPDERPLEHRHTPVLIGGKYRDVGMPDDAQQLLARASSTQLGLDAFIYISACAWMQR